MKKLTKSRNDRMLTGVCGGIAEYFGIDATIIRVIFALLVLSGGTGLLIYILLAVVMPEREDTYSKSDRFSPSGRPMHDAKPSDEDDDNWSDF